MVGSFKDCANTDDAVDDMVPDDAVDDMVLTGLPSPSDSVTDVITDNVCCATPTAVSSADSWGWLCEPAPALDSWLDLVLYAGMPRR